MVRSFVASLLLILSVSTHAQQNDLGELQVGADARNNQVYLSQTDAEQIAHEKKELSEKCDEHGCTYVSRVDHKKGWTVTFNVGNGNPNNGSGTTYYIGGNAGTTQSQNFASFTVSYQNMTCTSDFKIQEDEFLNDIGRAYAEREGGSTLNMKPLSPDMKFVQLVNLEIKKQLAQSGCLH